MVHLDESLVQAVEQAWTEFDQPAEEEPAADRAADRAESSLTVREIQARLRAGRSVDDVAAEAGVDPGWVQRFATPVLAEQARTVAAVRVATLTKARLGPSALPVGESVYRNLAERGLTATGDELDRGWAARQVAERLWVVTFTYHWRGRAHEAVWEFDDATHVVRARGRIGGQLAYRAPGTDPLAASGEGERSAGDRRRFASARKAATTKLAAAAKQAASRDAAATKKLAVQKEAEARRAEQARLREERDRQRQHRTRAKEEAAQAKADAERAEARRQARNERNRARRAEVRAQAEAAARAEATAKAERAARLDAARVARLDRVRAQREATTTAGPPARGKTAERLTVRVRRVRPEKSGGGAVFRTDLAPPVRPPESPNGRDPAPAAPRSRPLRAR